MNGLGGGGFMVVAKADGSPPEVVDFSMIAPAALDPADYPLAGGTAQALFSWPAVKEDRNLKGYHSIAVPGQVDGMRLALERFGSIGWRQALEPAIALGRARPAAGLVRDPQHHGRGARTGGVPGRLARSICRAGCRPCRRRKGPAICRSATLARTLRRLAEAGGRDFYEGEVAAALLRDLEKRRQPAVCCRSAQLSRHDRAGARHRLSRRERGGRAGPERRPDSGGRAGAADGFVAGYKARGRAQSGGLRGLRRCLRARLCGPARTPGRGRAGAVLHHPSQRGRSPRQHGGADADAALALRLQGGAAGDRHPHEQRHPLVRSAAGPAQLDRAGPAAARQHVPGDRAPRWRALVRARRLRRPAHHAGGGAGAVVPGRLRHDARGGVPPAAPGCQRRGPRRSRCSIAGRRGACRGRAHAGHTRADVRLSRCSSPVPARCCAIPPRACITAWARSPRPGPAQLPKRVDRARPPRPFKSRGSRGSGDDGETRGRRAKGKKSTMARRGRRPERESPPSRPQEEVCDKTKKAAPKKPIVKKAAPKKVAKTTAPKPKAAAKPAKPAPAKSTGKTIVLYPEAAFGPALNCVGIAQQLKSHGPQPGLRLRPRLQGRVREIRLRGEPGRHVRRHVRRGDRQVLGQLHRRPSAAFPAVADRAAADLRHPRLGGDRRQRHHLA